MPVCSRLLRYGRFGWRRNDTEFDVGNWTGINASYVDLCFKDLAKLLHHTIGNG